jgi:prepilin-type N-terminal cleavage/methylation domain-containing protein
MDAVVSSSRKKAGFSLVELVIVVVIVGIIAAIAIPRVSRGARGAGESALRSNLSVLRSAIELYATEHNGDHPAAKPDGAGGAAGSNAAFESQLLKYTDIQGNVSGTKDATHIYGPYLRKQIPPLPVGTNQGSNKVSVANNGPVVAVDDGTGWVYNCDTGEIIANADDMDDSNTVSYDQY